MKNCVAVYTPLLFPLFLADPMADSHWLLTLLWHHPSQDGKGLLHFRQPFADEEKGKVEISDRHDLQFAG